MLPYSVLVSAVHFIYRRRSDGLRLRTERLLVSRDTGQHGMA